MEVMVAVGLLGVVSLGVMSLVDNMSKSNLKARTDSDVLLTKNEIISMLSDPINCIATIPNISSPITHIKFKGQKKFELGSFYGDSSTVIKSYTLKYPGTTPTEATLIIDYVKKAMLGKGSIPRKINLYIETKPDGTVTHCRAVVFDPDIWTRGTGEWSSDIFFDGRVGIGTAEPKFPLHVKDSIMVNSENGDFSSFFAVTIDNDLTTGGGHPTFFGMRANGTPAALSYSKKGEVLSSYVGRDALAQINSNAATGVAKGFYGGAAMYFLADEDFSASSLGTKIVFHTTETGTNVPIESMVIKNDGSIVVKSPKQAYLHLAGSSEGSGYLAPTLSALYLGDGNTSPLMNSWYFAHKVSGELMLGKWSSNSAIDPLIILPSGNIGMSLLNPTEKLEIGGNLKVNGTIAASGTIMSASDERLKKDIKPLEDSLTRILSLNGVSYAWKKPKDHSEGEQIGVIAQDVEKVFPALVKTDKKGFKAVSYISLIAPIIESIRALFNISENQELQIQELKAENASLKLYLCQKDPGAKICQ